MSGLTYRDTKLSELTHDEVDENFRYLEQKANIYEVGQVYRGPVHKIYNGELYLLSSGVTFPFTAANFATELAAGNWQLVGSGTSYKGELNLTTPVLENGTGTIGDYYKVIESGNYDFGAGELYFQNGDFVLYNGSIYGSYVDNNQLFSSLYYKKEFDKIHNFTATGTDVVIPFHLYGYSTIELSGALTSVSGFSFTDLVANPAVAEYPHDGKSMFIINRSGHDITLKNADFASLAVVFFAFDGGNIVIPNNGKLELKYTEDGLIDVLKSWTEITDVTGLPEVLDLKADIAYVDALVVGLWDDRGSFDASSNTFPSTGGSGTAGVILKGDIWTISVAGTLGSELVEIGDTVRALVDSPSTTPSNWAIQQNNIGYVPENSANKVTTMTGNTTSNIVFLTAKAIYDWAVGLFVPQTRTLTIGAETFDLSANRTFSGGGGGVTYQYVRQFIPLFDEYVVAINTWRGWARNESNILNGKANVSLGTGSVPTNLFDCNFFLVAGADELLEVLFVANNSYTIKTYEIFIQSFTFINGTAIAGETNIQTLVQETITTAGSSLYTRVPLTVAVNTLGATTGIRLSWRHTGGGGAYITEAPQLFYKFKNA